MQAYDSKDMARSFRTVRANTIKIAEEIPEDKYGFRVAPGVRSVGETLAHIAVNHRWPKRMHGDEHITDTSFDYFRANMERRIKEESELTGKDQILDALRREGEEFAVWLESLSDAVLAERVNFPEPIQPSSKSRLEMLLGVKEHEMHHRGQLMIVQRALGIVPHLTREMEERMAQFAQQQQASQSA